MGDDDWDKDLPVMVVCLVGLVVLLTLIAIGLL